MSTMHNNIPTMPDRRLGAFLKVTRVMLLIFLAGGLLPVVPAFAQSTEAASTKTGSVSGTVVDTSSDPVPDAVVLQGPVGSRFAAVGAVGRLLFLFGANLNELRRDLRRRYV